MRSVAIAFALLLFAVALSLYCSNGTLSLCEKSSELVLSLPERASDLDETVAAELSLALRELYGEWSDGSLALYLGVPDEKLLKIRLSLLDASRLLSEKSERYPLARERLLELLKSVSATAGFGLGSIF